jgi:hypothetical protein
MAMAESRPPRWLSIPPSQSVLLRG